MPTAFEEITLAYKIVSGIAGAAQYALNNASLWFSDGRAKLLSSLTTLEFTHQGEDQIAYFVQDRTVKTLKNDTRLPRFKYGSEGKDTLETITISEENKSANHYTPKLFRQGNVCEIGIEEEQAWDKDSIFRCVLVAQSLNGSTAKKEWYISDVNHIIDAFTILIIFPAERLPKEIRAEKRKLPDGDWKTVRKEKNELRQFTGGRKAFLLETKILP